MTFLWIWPIVTVLAVAVVLVYLVRDFEGSTQGRVERTFLCPVDGQAATALLKSDFFDPEHYRDVILCSRYGMRSSPQCARACLALGKRDIEAQDAVLPPVYVG
jgi:hypothetical protein